MDGSFQGILNSLIADTLGEDGRAGSLWLFLPELVLCATIVLMLLVRVFNWGRYASALLLALIGSGIGLAAAVWQAYLLAEGQLASGEIFTGLLMFDSFTAFFRCLLLFFAVLFCILTWISGVPNRDDGSDIYTLVLGATLGMCLMASANHLLMVFLAVEMASVPSYTLAGMLRGQRKSSEAALKYAVYGAGAAGIMLYGISLLAGVLGTAHLPTMANQLASLVEHGIGAEQVRVLALGGLMVMVGLAFKLSAVPFHFWCPDVFEGATAEVNAFLSVASKAAALALLVRVALGIGYIHDRPDPRPADTQAAVSKTSTETEAQAAGVFNVAEDAEQDEAGADAPGSSATPGDRNASLQMARTFIVNLLALIAAITCTFGNLAAYGQSNIKRMLAYSTIAHAGYMIMPIAAAVAFVGTDLAGAQSSIAAVVFYICLYLFMNLGAFAIIAFLRNAIGSEEISDYAGLLRRCPITVVCFSLILVSLIGLPPLAGFAGKLRIFMQLWHAGGSVLVSLLVIAGINTVISLVYYLRVIQVMTMQPEPESRGPVSIGFLPGAYTLAMTIPVIVLGVLFNQVFLLALQAAGQLF